MSDPTTDLEAWNARYDAAIEAGADPAEAVAQADQAAKPSRPTSSPPRPDRLRGMRPDPEAIKRRQEFERWNAESEKVKARREAGIAHEQAVREARRREFHEAQKEATDEKAKRKIVKQHRSLDEP